MFRPRIPGDALLVARMTGGLRFIPNPRDPIARRNTDALPEHARQRGAVGVAQFVGDQIEPPSTAELLLRDRDPPVGQILCGGDVQHLFESRRECGARHAGSRRQRKTGLGDIVVGAALGYHHSDKLHSIVALDTYLPTGRYDKNDLANIGTNHWAVEPVYAVSYVQPKGVVADAKIGYIFNQRNSDTDYKSGDELHADYSAGWAFGNGWTAGVGGYALQQTTSDKQHGETLAHSKTRAFAIGPSVKYDSGKGWFASLKWQKEVVAQNRPEGNAVWLKAVFPLSK